MHSNSRSRTYSFTQSLPVDEAWDVVVLGGGPAGCAAAAASARNGARTLLVEGTGCLGGMGTSALVPAWTPYSDGERVVYRGLAQKVFEACKSGMAHVKKEDLNWVPIDPERLKRIYDHLVSSHGVEVRFNCHLAAVESREGAVRHVILCDKQGLRAISGKVFIDCTGDADLCAWAGAAFHKGDDHGKKLMPATLCFTLANVDVEALQNGPILYPGSNPKSPVYDILRCGKYPLIPDAHMCPAVIGPNTVGFNAGHLWNVDNTQPQTVSQALMLGREMASQYRDALAEFYPAAFANAFLVSTGALMGIRETRRIVGDYELTLDDYMARRSFEDEICRNSYFIDVHWAQENIAQRPEDHAQWDKSCFRYGPGESHGIPYRCLIPRALGNVLVAGRSISCEQIVQGSVRVMPVCLAMGEAAGMAAAIAAQHCGGLVREVDTVALRRALQKAGAYLPPIQKQVLSEVPLH